MEKNENIKKYINGKCCVMQKKDLYQVSDCLSQGFKGYPLFEYFSNEKYCLEKMNTFWNISMKSLGDDLLCVGDSNEPNAVALFLPGKVEGPGLFKYIRAGGLVLLKKMGITTVIRMLKFENLATKIKKKYSDDSCWYLYSFVVRAEQRKKGNGSKIIKPILDFFDKNAQSCYLETLKKENISMYKHLGFELMESVKLPQCDLVLYAMLREPRKKIRLNCDEEGVEKLEDEFLINSMEELYKQEIRRGDAIQN